MKKTLVFLSLLVISLFANADNARTLFLRDTDNRNRFLGIGLAHEGSYGLAAKVGPIHGEILVRDLNTCTVTINLDYHLISNYSGKDFSAFLGLGAGIESYIIGSLAPDLNTLDFKIPYGVTYTFFDYPFEIYFKGNLSKVFTSKGIKIFGSSGLVYTF